MRYFEDRNIAIGVPDKATLSSRIIVTKSKSGKSGLGKKTFVCTINRTDYILRDFQYMCASKYYVGTKKSDISFYNLKELSIAEYIDSLAVGTPASIAEMAYNEKYNDYRERPLGYEL